MRSAWTYRGWQGDSAGLEDLARPARSLTAKNVTLAADRDFHFNQVVQVPDDVGPFQLPLLALLLRKELEDRLARKERKLEWADIIRDLDNLIEMEVAIGGKGYVFRGQASGGAGKVFQACGVALPPALRPC